MSFTPEQAEALAAPLSRDHVKQRDQAGRKVSYIEGWVAIAEANRIFGFDAWDRETVDLRCVSERERKIGQQQKDGWQIGYIAKVRVTVRPEGAPIVREGTGYGSGIDVDAGAAHESAAKEAETDAMKRALMTFGNPFGLALYDKGMAQVEAPQRPARPATPTNGTPPKPNPLPEGKRQAASQARDRIKKALLAATTPKIIDDIISVNTADLLVIKTASVPAYEQLMTIANGRKTELLASA